MKINRLTATTLVALALMGTYLLAPGAAEHEQLERISLGFADLGDPGDWEKSAVPARPDPASPSWEWGAFEADPPRVIEDPSWEWGTPTSGPGAAHSGSNVWATNLAGPYNGRECSGIASPAITIPAGATASASFMHWRHMEASTFSGNGFDGGILFVTGDGGETLDRLVPTGGYDTSLLTSARGCLDGQPSGTDGFSGPAGSTPPGPGYTAVEIDLSAYAGQSLQLILGFGADCCTERDGWYIDDFAVTIDGNTTTEDFESGDGGFSVIGVRPLDPAGPGVAHSGTHVWATSINGLHNSRECAGIMSPPITVPSDGDASVSFWQWRHMQRSTATGTIFDGGRLFVTGDAGNTYTPVDAPTPAYDGGTLSSDAARCFDGMATSGSGAYAGPHGTTLPGPTYSQVSADLGAFAGQTVQFVISFGSNCCTERSGWYIDDFAVTIGGTTTVEDFESGDGGFSIVTTDVSPQRGWEFGTTGGTVGPALQAGESLWATVLDGDHGSSECTWIETPPIDLEGIAESGLPATAATLRWQHWWRSSSFSAAGVVQIGTLNESSGEVEYTNIAPTGGYPSDPSNSDLNACTGHRDQGSGALAGFIDANGDPMTDYDTDLSGYLGKTITVRFLFASTSSTSTNPGWYVDNVEIESYLYLGAPHVPDDLPVPNPTDQNAPLWTSGGEDSSWAYGVVTDPSTNADSWRGQIGYATNLAGPHNDPECSWIVSPVVPAPVLAADPTLVFEHAYRIAGASVDVAWGGGLVQVSTDGGVTWDYLDLPEYDRPLDYSGGYVDCFTGHGAPIDGNVFSGAHHAEFETVTVDLSDHVGAASIQVRFLFGAQTFDYEGWFIRQVSVGGTSLLP